MKSYSVKEIAEQADVSEETVRRWIRSGKLEATQLSRKQGNSITEESLKRFAATSPTNAARLAGLIGGMAALAPIGGAPLGTAAIVAGAAGLFAGIYDSLKDAVEQEDSFEKLARIIRKATQESDKLRASIKRKRERIDSLTREIEEEQQQIDSYDELIRDANTKMLSILSESEEDQ